MSTAGPTYSATSKIYCDTAAAAAAAAALESPRISHRDVRRVQNGPQSDTVKDIKLDSSDLQVAAVWVLRVEDKRTILLSSGGAQRSHMCDFY